MSENATIEINGKKYEFPIIEGTENEVAINIKTLRSVTGGVTTIDPGYRNTGSCESAITFLNGEEGILRYRGYAIEELAEKANFLEVAYLLIFGELPPKEDLSKFHNDIKEQSLVDEDVKKILGRGLNISVISPVCAQTQVCDHSPGMNSKSSMNVRIGNGPVSN